MGFRDETEAARARIADLERALEDKQRALEALRADLEVERASRVDLPLVRRPPAVPWQRTAELEKLKGRLAAAEAERDRLIRRRLPWRLRVVMFCCLALAVGLPLGLLRPPRGHDLVLEVCREQLRRHDDMRRMCE